MSKSKLSDSGGTEERLPTSIPRGSLTRPPAAEMLITLMLLTGMVTSFILIGLPLLAFFLLQASKYLMSAVV